MLIGDLAVRKGRHSWRCSLAACLQSWPPCQRARTVATYRLRVTPDVNSSYYAGFGIASLVGHFGVSVQEGCLDS
jgi:hypothetical protein